MMKIDQERINLLQSQQQIYKLSTKKRKAMRQAKRVWAQPLVDDAEEKRIIPLKICELDLEMKNIEIKYVRASFETRNSSTSDPSFSAYQLAQSKNPDYVNDKQFKIRFLRAKKYDAQEAARLILRHLKEKLDLFGSEKLTRDIYPEDVGDEGLRYLKSGGLKVLPKRDAKGRCLIFSDDLLKQGFSLLSVRKAHFHFMNSLAENVNYAKNGLGVATHGEMKCDATHGEMKYNDLYSIMNAPLCEWWEWIEDIPPIISGPPAISNSDVHDDDVLLGRGIKHPGNDCFRKIVADRFKGYETSTKKQQTQITNEIVEIITKDIGGRFLKKSEDNTSWEEINSNEARLKVAHTFRTIRKGKKKKNAAMLQ